MTPNPGHLPPEAIGKRVRVLLADGTLQGIAPVNADSAIGWRSETTRWSVEGSPFDVAEYEVIR